MKSIWKFPLKMQAYQEIVFPVNSKILTISMQSFEPYMWVEVDKDEKNEEIRKFGLIPTGTDISYEIKQYIGTLFAKNANIVKHFYEFK